MAPYTEEGRVSCRESYESCEPICSGWASNKITNLVVIKFGGIRACPAPVSFWQDELALTPNGIRKTKSRMPYDHLGKSLRRTLMNDHPHYAMVIW